MIEHSASVTIKAPVHQVYELFTHFSDFPKYMSAIREATDYDEQHSHWVVQVIKPYEWDAVHVDWITDQQVGWHSTRGFHNSGKVKFRPLGSENTIVDVYIQYIPPKGFLGLIAEIMVISNYFELILQKDLYNFAYMVEQTSRDALDPMSSHYLFHNESAAAKMLVTTRQLAIWQKDPMMSPQALAERQVRIEHEAEQHQHQQIEREAARRLRQEQEQLSMQNQQALLEHEAERRRQEAGQTVLSHVTEVPLDPHYTYAAWARGLGDKDGLRARIPNFTQDPMTSRRPPKH